MTSATKACLSVTLGTIAALSHVRGRRMLFLEDSVLGLAEDTNWSRRRPVFSDCGSYRVGTQSPLFDFHGVVSRQYVGTTKYFYFRDSGHTRYTDTCRLFTWLTTWILGQCVFTKRSSSDVAAGSMRGSAQADSNIMLSGFGHSQLHTVQAWNAAFPGNR